MNSSRLYFAVALCLFWIAGDAKSDQNSVNIAEKFGLALEQKSYAVAEEQLSLMKMNVKSKEDSFLVEIFYIELYREQKKYPEAEDKIKFIRKNYSREEFDFSAVDQAEGDILLDQKKSSEARGNFLSALIAPDLPPAVRYLAAQRVLYSYTEVEEYENAIQWLNFYKNFRDNTIAEVLGIKLDEADVMVKLKRIDDAKKLWAEVENYDIKKSPKIYAWQITILKNRAHENLTSKTE